jgi:hypothetical protein
MGGLTRRVRRGPSVEALGVALRDDRVALRDARVALIAHFD